MTDSEKGFIDHVHVTPANQAEVTELPNVIKEMEIGCLYADKGYASAANRNLLQKRGIEDGIMHKAGRNTPLTEDKKKRNREISKKRYVVEQSFGTLKRRFKFTRASYCSRIKVQAQKVLKALVYNLLKAFHIAKNQVKYA